MKKVYINPTTIVVEVKMTQHLLDGSATGAAIQTGNADAGVDVLSRGTSGSSSIWDDDEE